MAQDLVQMAKVEYESLIKQLEEKEAEISTIKKKLHPLGVFLKETGVLEKGTRKRDKK
jgi:L-rhamnose isomerase